MGQLISDLGLRISRVFRRTAPDPFVIAILLTLLTAVLALVFGDFAPRSDGAAPSASDRLVSLLDAWRSDSSGLWRFLAFGMQMCLILVTGHALACTKPVRALIDRLARIPRNTAGAALLIGFVACAAGLINWGLGLIIGALFAREVGQSLARRGIRAHYPLLAAAGYSTMMLWHGGLSGSAPLSITTVDGASKALSMQRIREIIGAPADAALDPTQTVIGLDQTIGSPLNLIITGGLLLGVPLLLMLLAPRRPEDMRPVTDFAPVEDAPNEDEPIETLPDRLDRSLIVALCLAVPLVLAVMRYVAVSGLGNISLNVVNGAMFALGLLLHASPRSYMQAIAEGARGCGGIIIQFPLYGGIMGMMESSGLVTKLATWFIEVGNETTMPMFSMVAAGIVNLFVPSGGGQWAIQGPIALEAGMAAGVSPGRMVMAVAYGDQLTNMLQPFWALPLLAITGVKARDIVGYTAIIMLAGAAWIALGLLLY